MPFHYVHRDHRKLIVIDQAKAFTGGLNIANEYSGFHLRRRSRGWRDTGVLLEGPIVKELLETYWRSWYTWGGEQIDVGEDEEDFLPMIKKGRSLQNDSFASRCCGNMPVLPIFAYSGRGRRRMRNLLPCLPQAGAGRGQTGSSFPVSSTGQAYCGVHR